MVRSPAKQPQHRYGMEPHSFVFISIANDFKSHNGINFLELRLTEASLQSHSFLVPDKQASATS